MIRVTPQIAIDEGEVSMTFVRSSGPGGQNVNKVSSAVELRFDVAGSSLPADVRQRLIRLSGRRVTDAGVLIIDARRHRTQEANRRDAMERLVELIRQAAEPPRPRHKTRPTFSSKRRRLDSKRHRGQVKRLRSSAGMDE